jgi:ornithine cyclodeaminase/alanine dehydrogenase
VADQAGAPLLYLSRDDVAALLPDVVAQIDLTEATYRAMAGGTVEMPPKPGIHPRPDAFIHAMPAYLSGTDVAAVKWVSGYPANGARGLPYISGLIVVNDAGCGIPLAVMDAVEITAARTAAASGVCVRRWAPEGFTRAAILGCGEQGRYHAAMLRALNPRVEIAAWDPDPARIAGLGDRVAAAPDARAAVAGAQVVVTAAPIVEHPRPPVAPDWLAPEHLVLPLDFDANVQAAAVAAADLFLVDDVDQFEHYRARGHFADWPRPAGEVGAAVSGAARPARVACCNLGVGSLDAAFADAVYRAARAAGAGAGLPV